MLFGYNDVGDENMGNDKAIEDYVERKAATRRSILEKGAHGRDRAQGQTER
jgi:hypothetical protein